MHRPSPTSATASTSPLRLDLLFALLSVPILLSRAASALDWQPLGPEGGSIVTLAIAPSDPTRVWVGGDGGVFRSLDGGATWTSVPVPLGGFAPHAIAIDPQDASRVWIATDGGLLLSDDDGATFAPAGLDGEVLLSLHIDPSDELIVRAGSAGGAFLTTNGGAAWTPIAGGLPAADGITAWARAADGELFAGTDAGEVYHSPDGATWTSGTGLGGAAITGLHTDPGDADLLWASTEGDGVFRSDDGGATWDAVNTGLTDLAALDVALDTRTARTLYASTELEGVFTSIDDGDTWTSASAGLGLAPIFRLAVPPSGNGAVLGGSEGEGIFATTDGGLTWLPANHGLRLASIGALAVSGSPTRIYAGSVGEGVYVSADGVTWTLTNQGLGSLGISDVVADPADPLRAWVAAEDADVYATIDGGANWTATNLPNDEVVALERDPVVGTLYAATDGGAGVYRSTGGPWSGAGSGLTNTRLRALSIDPTRPQRLFAFTRNGLFRTTNGATSWTASGSGLGVADVHAVAFDPALETRLWASTNLGLFRSLDGGATWVAIAAATLPDPLLLRLHYDGAKRQLWVGTEAGEVYRSTDGGSTFVRQQGGVTGPAAAIFAQDAAGDLHLGTGQGVFRLRATQFSDGFETGNAAAWAAAVGF